MSSSSPCSSKVGETMKCSKCQVGTVELERVSRPFSTHLPNVTIDGVEHGTCSSCGEEATSYPRWAELSALVLGALLAKPSRLTAGEIRFLRLKTGLKAQALAKTLGVTPSQVSRWENGAVRISTLADRLLRMVASAPIGAAAPDLVKIDASSSQQLELHVELAPRGWKVVESDAQAA